MVARHVWVSTCGLGKVLGTLCSIRRICTLWRAKQVANYERDAEWEVYLKPVAFESAQKHRYEAQVVLGRCRDHP